MTHLIQSSHGTLTTDSTGKVIEKHTCIDEGEHCDGCINDYDNFDFEEYKKHYNVDEVPGSIDILDLGYFVGETYEAPDEYFRANVKEEMSQAWMVIR